MVNGLGGGGMFVPAKMSSDELADLTVSPLPSLHVTKYFFFVEYFYLFISCNVWPVSPLIRCFYVFHSNLTGLPRLIMQCLLLFSRKNNDYFIWTSTLLASKAQSLHRK